ncbi:MAG: glycoside hydrolase family 13 protein [Clostridiales bacterium]|jgi:glycosidase|nr:glycoside hydrolase family 13 protein [Clostridiales bacterium]
MNNIAYEIVGTCALGGLTRFRIKIRRRAAAVNVYLVINKDFEDEVPYRLSFAALEDGWDVFCAELTIGTPGLYFYYFRADGEIVGLNGEYFAAQAGARDKFQLLVYERRYDAPEYLYGGVMYQIFPDRFFRAGNYPPREGVHMHADWYESPEYLPDPTAGEVLNIDFFGGTIRGITEKLDYLKSLSVSCIYLNPIFAAYSNHKYDTGDYMCADEMFGTNGDFTELCGRAEARGISVILDGVFSHTGAVSRYFNKDGRYDGVGAYQSEDSPYSAWYSFKRFPSEYLCWWNFPTLPNVNELDPSYDAFINGADGVIRTWIRRGAAGYRLDVADELPDKFIENLAAAAKAERADAAVYGEVWEDASNKMSYGARRRYFWGSELDSVMNYPFRNAIIDYVLNGDPLGLATTAKAIVSRYPPNALNTLMNMLSTHDTERILTVLSGVKGAELTKEQRAGYVIPAGVKEQALQRLRMAAVIQYTLPGIPSVFYGDEAGLEGFEDPFCRRCYPWGREDKALLAFYKRLGAMRAACPELKTGAFRVLRCDRPCGVIIYERADVCGRLIIIVNAGKDGYTADTDGKFVDAFTGKAVIEKFTVAPCGYAALRKKNRARKDKERAD